MRILQKLHRQTNGHTRVGTEGQSHAGGDNRRGSHTYVGENRIGCVFFSSRRRHTRYWRDWSSDVCSSDLVEAELTALQPLPGELGKGGVAVLVEAPGTQDATVVAAREELPDHTLAGDLAVGVVGPLDCVEQHVGRLVAVDGVRLDTAARSEEHTSELQSRQYLVCRL